MVAAYEGNATEVRGLIECPEVDINQADSNGQTGPERKRVLRSVHQSSNYISTNVCGRIFVKFQELPAKRKCICNWTFCSTVDAPITFAFSHTYIECIHGMHAV